MLVTHTPGSHRDTVSQQVTICHKQLTFPTCRDREQGYGSTAWLDV